MCFGSSEETCQDNNLYRIIGLFGDRVKLIKWDYANNALLGTDGDYGVTYANSRWDTSYYQRNVDTSTIGTYFWSGVNASASYKETGSYNDWSYSQLNTVNLNTNYLANIRTEWANMIDTTTWKVGGNTYANMYQSNAKTAYTNEITSPSTQATSTYESKVGLMYVSDYYYGASPTYWTYPGYSSSGASYDYRTATGENWMYMGLYEWTMARSSSTFNAFYVGPGGSMSYDDVNAGFFAIRPVFYLNSDVTYISGSGTKSDPICIN